MSSAIGDGRFEEDFKDLYRYYKHTFFAKFSRIGPYLFMVFRIGRAVTDIKTFKWLIQGNTLRYLDNRSDHECVFPPQHEFEWTRTTQDMFHEGKHPHISIQDRVFVETVGGDLTVKIEDNTETEVRLRAAGCEVWTYRGAEISHKAEGGATCLTRPILRSA